MDEKTLIKEISDKAGLSSQKVTQLIEGFAKIIVESATEGNSVAIPSFGTFTSTKLDETIVKDQVTGKMMMLPPQITLEFQPATMLRKRLNETK